MKISYLHVNPQMSARILYFSEWVHFQDKLQSISFYIKMGVVSQMKEVAIITNSFVEEWTIVLEDSVLQISKQEVMEIVSL